MKGGSGVEFWSEEQKINAKKPKPIGFGDKVTHRLTGIKQSPETIKKRREKLIGKKKKQ